MHVDAATDHIELADTYFMLGLNIGWENQTESEETLLFKRYIFVFFPKDVITNPFGSIIRVILRLPGQKVISKTSGTKFFKLPAGESHVAGIRFYTRSRSNLEEGTYPVDVHTTVASRYLCIH